jgi:hypothetical protein
MRTEPTSVTILRPGPDPVNAKEPDAAVTTRLDVEDEEDPAFAVSAAFVDVVVAWGAVDVGFRAVVVVPVLGAVVVV